MTNTTTIGVVEEKTQSSPVTEELATIRAEAFKQLLAHKGVFKSHEEIREAINDGRKW